MIGALIARMAAAGAFDALNHHSTVLVLGLAYLNRHRFRVMQPGATG